MGFAINPSLNYLDIPEAFIHEFYRSTSEKIIPDARFRGHPCEAFLCISKVETELRAYVAILNTVSKNIFVYTSDFVTRNSAEYPQVLNESLAYLTSLGFTMEKVNIDFSPAMREVIIKGFRVMRPPPPPKKTSIRPPKIDLPAQEEDQSLAKILSASESSHPDEFQDCVTELLSTRAELVSVRSALEQMTREKVLWEQSAATERQALQSACEQAMEGRRKAETMLAEAALGRSDAPPADDADSLRIELAQLQDQLTAARASTVAEVNQHRKELENARESLEQLRSDLRLLKDQHTAESTSSATLLAKTVEEKTVAESRLGELESSHQKAMAKISVLAAVEQSLEESRKRETLLTAEIANIKEELSVTRAERERLRADSAGTEEMVTRTGQLAAELQAVEAEYVRLANSSRETESVLSDRLITAEAENERLARELDIQEQVAAREQAALRAELRRLIVEGGAGLSLPPELSERPVAKVIQPAVSAQEPTTIDVPRKMEESSRVSPPEAEDNQQLPVPERAHGPQSLEQVDEDESPDRPITPEFDIMKEFTGEFGGFTGGGGTSATEFKFDASLTGIPYQEPEQILALFYSSNTVQAVPDGSSIQKCKSYVAAVKTGAEYRIYVAWHLTESERVVIYLPDQQPVDRDGCIRILKDAIAYFEIIGFMMEVADLGTTVKSHRKALKKIPALCRVS